MRIPISFRTSFVLVLLGCWLASAVLAQAPAPGDPISVVPFDRGGTRVTDQTAVRWKINKEHSLLVLTVSHPDGTVQRQEFKAGEAPVFKLADDKGLPLADGQYQYELRLTLQLPAQATDALALARARELEELESEWIQEKSDSATAHRALVKSGVLPREPMLLSGAFTMARGVVYLGLASDRTGTGSLPQDFDPRISQRQLNPESDAYGRNQARLMPAAMKAFDQVIPDDLIVQGSTCVGFDCVNNENFGFDTIRMKENNTRIKFDDTSANAGFPANDWQLTANDSSSGGANKFSIEDITGAKVPFTVTAGAATNSIFVDSTGRVGFRTSTPVLDLHVSTGNTPAHRLEQNGSSGFTAQTWDVAGNEANFFVRDVTGGSRLPFRIRPGAPTSSLDISAAGNVGVGTASPSRKLEVSANGSNVGMKITDTGLGNAAFLIYLRRNGAGVADRQLSFFDEIAGADRLVMNASGFLGLGGLVNPTNPIHHNNGAFLSAGGAWTNASSKELKTNIHKLNAQDAFTALRQLNPVQFQYKAAPAEHHVGFIAEEVPDLVASADRKGLSSMDLVAVLTKVVQTQQQAIADLQLKVERLEKVRVKRNRQARKR